MLKKLMNKVNWFLYLNFKLWERSSMKKIFQNSIKKQKYIKNYIFFNRTNIFKENKEPFTDVNDLDIPIIKIYPINLSQKLCNSYLDLIKSLSKLVFNEEKQNLAPILFFEVFYFYN
jgi:hypothetical protein